MDEKNEDFAFLFGNEGRDRPQWDAQKRFMSDDFRPVYTQGITAKGHLPEAIFARFVESLRDDPSSAIETFRNWIMTARPQGGLFADVAMDRMEARSTEWDAETAKGAFWLFCEIMDEFYRTSPKSKTFFDVWEQSEQVINELRGVLGGVLKRSVLQKSVREGDALSWMLQMVGRRELWARGLAGDRPRRDGAFLMSEDDLRIFIRKLFSRIKLLKNKEILDMPRFLGVLYSLKESPWDSRAFQNLLNRLYGPAVRDREFLLFLVAAGGAVVSSSRGAYTTLSRETLTSLLDGDYIEERLGRIRKKRVGREVALLRSEVDAMIERASSY